jgi:hypothetical protein
LTADKPAVTGTLYSLGPCHYNHFLQVKTHITW